MDVCELQAALFWPEVRIADRPARDPSLRLKNGSALDDAFTERGARRKLNQEAASARWKLGQQVFFGGEICACQQQQA